jgi:hypothetical protein
VCLTASVISVIAPCDDEEIQLRAGLEPGNERRKKVIYACLEELSVRPDKCLLGSDAERLQ